jgi:hypothetical protein
MHIHFKVLKKVLLLSEGVSDKLESWTLLLAARGLQICSPQSWLFGANQSLKLSGKVLSKNAAY